MEFSELSQFAAASLLLICLGFPLGRFMASLYGGQVQFLSQPLGWMEEIIFDFAKIDRSKEMTWKQYASALLIFNFAGLIFLMVLLLCQGKLPLNPNQYPGLSFLLTLNTGVSFVTNTNWQAYSGEAVLSHLTQMVGLGVQNFLSAASGMAVAVALARGIDRANSQTIGSFWVDLIRSVIYILLPLSLILAFALVSQGVVESFRGNLLVHTLEGNTQLLPLGPTASQVAIKQLGSNGGGFYGVNSAHPFENPTPISNYIELLAMLLIPFSMPIMFGHLVKSKGHGRSLLMAMSIIFICVVALALWSEFSIHSHSLTGPSLEGKEVRFGLFSSVIWAAATTATSNGSVNAMLSSLSPLTGGLALLNIMLGEVIFGGVGSGIYGMVLFVILTVFMAGLMVGRTPEYLGKKIEASEVKWAVFGLMVPNILILLGSAIAANCSFGLLPVSAKGPHGLSEILYAFSSASGNNGSAFSGLQANTSFYNVGLALCMILGRYLVMIAVLAISGSLALKKVVPLSKGSFAVEGTLFVTLLIAVILMIGALTFLPALSLGPIAEHVLMLQGKSF